MSRGNKEKFVAVFLALTFVVTSFFYVAQPAKIFAQESTTFGTIGGAPVATFTIPGIIPKPSLVVGDLWGSFLQGVIKAGESAGYTILRKYMRKALQNLTKDVWKQLLTGGKGQSEVFQTQPWGDFWDEAGNEAVGSAIEGFAQGFQNEYEFSKKKAAVRKDLGIEGAVKENIGEQKGLDTAPGSIGAERRVISDEMTWTQRIKAQSGCVAQPGNTWVIVPPESTTPQPASQEDAQNCQSLTDRYNKLSGGLDQLIGSKQVADKADADLIAGNTGALSEASRVLIDVVCKPEPDIAFKIFLGLGDQIELKKRSAICPLDTLTKNWQAVVSNTGPNLNMDSIQAWNALAGLVDPDASDLGVSWKLSVAGHSIKDIAQALGVTDFGAIASQGGIKDITDFSGKTTTPAGVVRSLAENSLKVQIEEDTRFIPTGHLLADLILTAGSTVLSTSLDILKEGLRKKQAVARKGVTGTAFAQLTRGNNVLYNPSMNPDFGGVEAADARLAEFSRLDLSPPQDWNVLAKLTSQSCPDGMPEGAKGGEIDACVLDDKFAEAVKERITVKEALARGLLNKDGAFGFDVKSGGVPRSLSWQRNFPYRSLVILRKYRVLPVSWELAALYIEKNSRACDDKNCTLKNLIEKSKDSSSPFYGMIDENWVLKIPPVRCALKGYGPEYQDSTTSPEYEKNDLTMSKTVKKVNRAPEQCVDYQTCLDEDEEGKCRDSRYGYCLQEQKVIRFKGEKCTEVFAGCESFQDTQTKGTAGYIKQSLQQNADLATGKCTARNAGCQWYSKTRGVAFIGDPSQADLGVDMKAKVSTQNIGGTLVQQEWLSAPSDKVYFASSAQKCDDRSEGCRQVSGPAGTPDYLRLPPPSLQCLTDGIKDGVVVPWYKREDCKEYTQLCTSGYEGCQQYLPQGESGAVTGKVFGGPSDINQNRCPFACANIQSFAEQKTLFDKSEINSESAYFNADTAQKCSIADEGCEEFTNLDAVARGGEGKEQYTYLQRCEQGDPETISANEVFYSFVGSDTAGGQPEKYYLKGEGTPGTNDYKPACAEEGTACHCTAADQRQNDPRVGEVLCREFINPNGKVFYRWTDRLVYRTADCTSYRRTLDGTTGLANTYSPRYSRACSTSAVNCREYRAPQAGNVRIVSHDNFEDGTIGAWKENLYSNANFSAISNEGEIIGDHSVVLKKPSNITWKLPRYRFAKPISFSPAKNYQLIFNIKGREGLVVEPYLRGQDSTGTEVILESLPSFIPLNADWKHLSFGFKKHTTDEQLTNTEVFMRVYIQGHSESNPTEDAGPVYIDDIVVKEFTGIEYLIRDSWIQNGSCFNPKSTIDPAPNFSDPAYPNCSLYTDKEGTQHALMSFERVCPNEMAGCVRVTVKEDKIVTDPSDGTKKILVDVSRYIIPDESKACRAEDNKCTAYGSPKLLTSLTPSNPSPIKRIKADTIHKEEWNIAYYKVTPLDVKIAENKFTADNLEPYENGICRQTDLGCREYAVGSKGDRAYFRNPGVRACQPPAAGETSWFYHACEESAATDDVYDDIVCASDSDCPVTGGVQEKCDTKKKERCHVYKDTSGQASEPAPLVKCPCDKDNNKLECANASGLPTDPSRCKDVFDNGSLSHLIIIDPIFSSFALACPASAVGCRKVSDPECFGDTLRSDYGRDTATQVPCTPAYYFTEDLDPRTKECNGKVNVEEGCLLFNDEKKKTYEYTKDGVGGDAILVPNPLHCSCDTNPAEPNCTPTFSATEFEPGYCYDQYSTPDGVKLQKYTRNQTDLKYPSLDYYAQSRTGGSVNLGSITTNTIKDANVLMKVKQDRQCKTWLKCTGFWKEGGREICFKRDLCNKWGVGNSCDGSPATSLEGSNGLVTGSATGAGILPSLSGVARPDYQFPSPAAGGYKTGGGYGFDFMKWRQTPETDVGNRSYSRLDLTGNTAVRIKANIINSCRLYPQQTTGVTTPSNIVDACRVEAGSYGIYGYCLEPYPDFKPEYYGKNNYYRKVCTNNIDPSFDRASSTTECTSDADCPGGKCGFRYYENACLTWLPVDRIEGQRNLFTAQTGQELAVYNGPESVYYCAATVEIVKNGPTITYTPPPLRGPLLIHVRDSKTLSGSLAIPDWNTLGAANPVAPLNQRYPYVYAFLEGDTVVTNPQYLGSTRNTSGIGEAGSSWQYPDEVYCPGVACINGANSTGALIMTHATNEGENVTAANDGAEATIQHVKNSDSYSVASGLFMLQYSPIKSSTEYLMYNPENYILGEVGNMAPNTLEFSSIIPPPALQGRGDQVKIFNADKPFVYKIVKNPTDITEYIIVDGTDDYKEVRAPNTISDLAIIQAFKNGFSANTPTNPTPVTCPRDVMGEPIIYVGVMPVWVIDSTDGKQHLSGFDYAICRDATLFGIRETTVSSGDVDGDGNPIYVGSGSYTMIHKSAFGMGVSVFTQPITYYSPKIMTYKYKETYCSAYLSTVRNGQAVPNGAIDTVFNIANEGAVNLPAGLADSAGNPKDLTEAELKSIKPVAYKRVGIGWQNTSGGACTATDVTDIQGATPSTVTLPAPEHNITQATFVCTQPPMMSPQENSPCERNFFCDRISADGSDGKKIKVIGNVPQFFAGVRTMLPHGFAKIYDYWPYQIDRFIREDSWDETEQKFFNTTKNEWNFSGSWLLKFWQDSKAIGRGGTNPPRIYGASRAKPNEFTVETIDKNKIEVRFYATVKENQRPIKLLRIEWGDGNTLDVANSTFDGRGTAPKPPPANKETPDIFSGYGPFHYEYTDNPDTTTVDESLRAGKRVTVKIKDNWDVVTETRGIFAEDGTTINFSHMSF